MTVLLGSINLHPPVKNTAGIDLWYGNFKYKIKIKFPSIHRVRYLHSTVDLKKYLTREFWIYNINKDGGDAETLARFVSWRHGGNPGLKTVINNSCIIFYYNDPSELSTFFNEFPDKEIISNEYRVKLPGYVRGVVYRVNPKNKYRVYLHASFMDMGDMAKLYSIIQEQNLRMTTGFSRRIQKFLNTGIGKFLVWDNNFVDLDNESVITVLLLNFPTLVRQVCEIKHKPE